MAPSLRLSVGDPFVVSTVTAWLIASVIWSVCPVKISPVRAAVTELTKAGPTCRLVVKLAAAERSAALPLGSLIVAPLRLTWAI